MNVNDVLSPAPSQDGLDREWKNAKKELLGLENYHINWDGEGADPVSPELIRTTSALYESMRDLGYPAPCTVYPTPGGTVMFEVHFENGDVISVNVRQTDRAEVVSSCSGKKPEFEVVQLPLSTKAAFSRRCPLSESSPIEEAAALVNDV
ncbi:MAG: hypothetical protein K8T89_07755 [Planctomycetes bacterium]|nr:hypothetical protein [Planctomycetota bacterium]